MLHAFVILFPITMILMGIFTAVVMGIGLFVGGLVGWHTHSMDNFVGTWIFVTAILTIVLMGLFIGWLV